MLQSIVVIFVVLMINFTVLPKILETLEEFQIQIQPIKNRIYVATIGILAFVFLFNFYFWRIANKLEKEKKEPETILRMNLSDPIAQEKIRKIEKKIDRYYALAETIFIMIIGIAVGFMAFTIIQPMYTFLGTL